MNTNERIAAVKYMNYLARACNNEDITLYWLACGVADGDTEDDFEYYTDDDTFSELMHTFLFCMSKAYHDGGLYIDDIVSE